MSLESANYIPELNANNPTATDPVSEGDNHIGMVKKVLKQTFPGFIGTTGSPKAVTLTEDQINAAALKIADQTFLGQNTFNQVIVGTTSGNLVPADLPDLDPYPKNADPETISGAWNFTGGLTDTGQTLAKRRTPNASSASATASQAFEDRVTRATGNITLPTGLVAGSTLAFMTNGNGASINMVQGSGLTLQWLDGKGGTQKVGTRAFAPNSFCVVYYTSTSQAQIFGNGLS